jgi:hypothetical protein
VIAVSQAHGHGARRRSPGAKRDGSGFDRNGTKWRFRGEGHGATVPDLASSLRRTQTT